MNSVQVAVLVLMGLSNFARAGFLSAPFPYFAHHGAPITSAASPFIHGFGAPLLQPIVYKHFQPQPLIFYQPLPQVYTVLKTAGTAPPASTGPSGPAPEKEARQSPQQEYGPPSSPSGSANQYQSSPSGSANQYQSSPSGSANQYQSSPSGSANQYQSSPSGSANQYQSSPSGYNGDNYRSGPSGGSGYSNSGPSNAFNGGFQGGRDFGNSDRAGGYSSSNNNPQRYIANQQNGPNNQRNSYHGENGASGGYA